MSAHDKSVKLSEYDFPVIRTSPIDRISTDESVNKFIIHKHGCIEAFYFNKAMYYGIQATKYKKRLCYHKRQLSLQEQQINTLQDRLASANSIIDAYEEIYD
jgi:hypothetical protein